MKPNFKLEDLKRENVYQVPEQYFDKLPNRIMQRVTAGADTRKSVLSGFPAKLRLALAGTGFAAVFATVFLLNYNQNPTTQPDLLAGLNQTEVLEYLLASEHLERGDLALLNATDRDLTAQFIAVNPNEIRQELEDQHFEDLYQ